MEEIEKVFHAVRENPRYQMICEDLVRRVVKEELGKGRRPKEAVKAARSTLHQVGGAYQAKKMEYDRWMEELYSLPSDTGHPDLQAFCRQVMEQHTSTAERLPILEDFFYETLGDIAPVRSVLDLACGLNPLAIPWMPLDEGFEYHACDIYTDMNGFLQRFFDHLGVKGNAFTCDLTATFPSQPIQLAMLLKSIPCLEQLDKNIAARFFDTIQAQHLLISFPVHSIGGREKGMIQHYEQHFQDIVPQNWHVNRKLFLTELSFFLTRQ